MNEIRQFKLKNVRCFEGVQEFNIRPLTFLVGENSTGKSTVLGCMQALGNCIGQRTGNQFNLDFNVDFNVNPYQMGAFPDIARKVGGRGGRSNRFQIGFTVQIVETETVDFLVTLIERESGSEPSIQQMKVELDEGTVIFNVKRPDKKDYIPFPVIRTPRITKSKNGNPIYTFDAHDENELQFMFVMLHHPFLGERKKSEGIKNFNKFLEKAVSRLNRNGETLKKYRSRDARRFFPPYASLDFESFAPVRSKPIRTYNPVKGVDDPEGSGMPMTLMNMYRNDKDTWKVVQEKLVKFGRASGLFTNIDIKKHGRATNDPFQLHVKVRGPQSNIVDTGYGISQILPILVRIFEDRQKTSFLVQQPEVHLHPRGQAELTSLLGEISKSEGHSFVIETHSDYMVDRARIEIMKKRIKPEDVSLIYLEPKDNKVDVHNIRFDAMGNMEGAPGSYRKFFLKETDSLLGFGD